MLRNVPHDIVKQSTGDPTDGVNVIFAADIVKRARQLILVVRECATSYTSTYLVEDDRHETKRGALIRLCVELRMLDGPLAVICTDPAPGFTSLVDDKLLLHHRIDIKIGWIKNNNKNPVVEKAISELEDELFYIKNLWVVQ